jgi:hypothetical protein
MRRGRISHRAGYRTTLRNSDFRVTRHRVPRHPALGHSWGLLAGAGEVFSGLEEEATAVSMRCHENSKSLPKAEIHPFDVTGNAEEKPTQQGAGQRPEAPGRRPLLVQGHLELPCEIAEEVRQLWHEAGDVRSEGRP